MTDDVTPQQFIENEHKTKKVVIWALSACKHCKAAKKLILEDKLEKFDDPSSAIAVHDVDTMEGGGHVKTTLFRLNSQRMYPNIYINGKHIGGNDSLQKLNESGELDKLLAKTYPSKWAIK